jgi:hypothetical protein
MAIATLPSRGGQARQRDKAQLDYTTLSREPPPGVEPAYDGLTLEFG